MNYHVSITDRAQTDLGEIFDYIAMDSPDNARRFRDRIIQAIERLEHFPNRCRRAPESNVFKAAIRQLIVGRYRILFTVEGEDVIVLHVRHAARRPLHPDDQ